MEGWFADRHRFSAGQFLVLRDACTGCFAGYSDQVSAAGCCGWLCCCPVQECILERITGRCSVYQVVGTLAEWAYVGDLRLALQDFRIGLPGMLLQVVGGYWVLRRIMQK